MKKNKLIISIFSLFLLWGCYEAKKTIYHSTPEKKEQASLENAVLKRAAIKLKKEHNKLLCVGSGGRTSKGVEKLELCFNYYNCLNIEESRKLLIHCVNVLVHEVNAEKKIHPFLCNYPFNPSNVGIRIGLQNPDGSEVELGKLSFITAVEGTLRYKTNNPDTNMFNTILMETYDEALEKLNDQ